MNKTADFLCINDGSDNMLIDLSGINTSEPFDYDYKGEYMLRIVKTGSGFKVVNAMNGWGSNCKLQFEKASVIELYASQQEPSMNKTVEEIIEQHFPEMFDRSVNCQEIINNIKRCMEEYRSQEPSTGEQPVTPAPVEEWKEKVLKILEDRQQYFKNITGHAFSGKAVGDAIKIIKEYLPPESFYALQQSNASLQREVEGYRDENSQLKLVATELEREVERLKVWKQQAIEVTPDMQAIGKLLNLKPGQMIHEHIIPKIEELKSKVAELENQLQEAKERETTLTNALVEAGRIIYKNS